MNEQENRTVNRNVQITTNGNNNGQWAIGDTVIQFGAVNGGEVNLQPAAPPPSHTDDSAPSLTAGQRKALVALRRVLTQLFDHEELRDLIFDLAIDYDSLPGAAKKDKARELISFCWRRGRLPELKQAVLERRPGAL